MSLSKSYVVVTSIQSMKNCSFSRPEYALIYKTKYKRREITLLVCFLPLDDGRKLADYQETTDKMKSLAKTNRCTCLTESLQIVEIDHDEDYPWWNQFFVGSDQQQPQINHYQLMYYDLDDGNRNYDHLPSKTGQDNDWSLLLNRINNCHSIRKIVLSGNIPNYLSVRSTKRTPLNSDNNNNNSGAKFSPPKRLSTMQRVQILFFDNSLTILHFRDLWFTNQIALVRCIRSFRSLRNDASVMSENIPTNYCNYCVKPCLVASKSELAIQTISRLNDCLASLCDVILGLMVCVVLLFASRNLGFVQTFYLDIKLKTFQYLEDQSYVLETFPVGFKLNVQLTHNMGRGIRNLLHHKKNFLLATLWDLQICQEYLLPTLATLAAMGGWTTFLAIMVDLWRLEFFHLILLTSFFRKLYRAELYLLSALFRLFRGKKRNILRQRTDSMQYDAMQLLVGTVAFCICVFLWTTIMVYHSFFVIWSLLMYLPIIGCWMLYLLNRSIPWGSLYFRFRYPYWFSKDLYIKFNDIITIDSKNVQVTSLESILESPLSILLNRITIPMKHLFQWYFISFLEILYPRASNSSHYFLPLKLSMNDLKTLHNK